ncbi:MAG: hypothetical protein DRQ62_10400, partial [Gammaproteobacteria bacterium]
MIKRRPPCLHTSKLPLLLCLAFSQFGCTELRGTGDLGVIIEREPAAIQIINTSTNNRISRIAELGDLSHASIVYSRDA